MNPISPTQKKEVLDPLPDSPLREESTGNQRLLSLVPGEENKQGQGVGGWGIVSWIQLSFSWQASGEVDSGKTAVKKDESEISEEWKGYLDDALASEAEIIKASNAAQKVFGSLMGWTGQKLSRASSTVINKIASSFNQFDQEKVVSEQKRKMLNDIKDPQFVEFYQLTASALLPPIREKVLSLSKGSDLIAEVVSSQKEMILSVVEVVLARGFANLAQQMNEHKDEIPNFDHQPSLVSMISLLSRRVGDGLNQKDLSDIEMKYRGDESGVRECLSKLFPEIDKDNRLKQWLELEIKGYIQTQEKSDKKQIIETLRSRGREVEADQEVIQQLFLHLDNLHQKNRELKIVFDGVSEQILLSLFPNKLRDLEELKGNLMNCFGDYAFNFIRDSIAEMLKDSYEPVEDNSVRREAWENTLKEVLGVDDLEPIIEAPTALMEALSKDYIQSDPSIIKAVTKAIHGVVKRDGENKDDVLSQLSQQQLASWMVESAQVMLNSQDRHITRLESFVKQSFNHVTLALMAKGAKLVIPEGTKIKPEAFLKEFGAHLIEKIKNMKAEDQFSGTFLNDLTADLPLPPMMKEVLVPILGEKGKTLQSDVVEKRGQLEASQALYAEVYRKIQRYEEGEKLLSITEQMTKQLLDQVFEKKMDLISTLGLGETLDELFAQYLPGIEGSEDLKEWFKDNITTLGMTEEGGEGSHTVTFLQEGIQTVFLKAMVDVIEKNFNGDSKDYAAQLLTAFHAAFAKAFEGGDEEQSHQLDGAFKIQVEIDQKNHALREIKKTMEEIPEGISIDQKRLFEDALAALSRENRAEDNCSGLREKLQEALKKLNTKQKIRKWSADDFSRVGDALVLRKIEEGRFNSSRGYIEDLKGKVDTLLRQEELSAEENEDLLQRQVLLALLETPPHALRLFSEAMDIQTTIAHAEKELNNLKRERAAQTQKIEDYGKGAISNKKEWESAHTWYILTLSGKWKSRNLASEIAKLEDELDKHLKPFQSLSKELSTLLGWEGKESLNLPPFLQDHVWGVVESAQQKQLARLLFYQMVPLLNSYNNIESNREELSELSLKNPLLGQLISAASKEVIGAIPEFFTSYQPSITQTLTSMPGGEELHSLIIPQLEAVIVGDDSTFNKNRGGLQDFLEGSILSLAVKIARHNKGGSPGEDPLTVMMEKLKALVEETPLEKGGSREDISRQMIDNVLADIFDIRSEESLEMIPPALRHFVFEKIREKGYQELAPLLLPIIDRKEKRALLKQHSGSEFLGALCQALSKDVFSFGPGLLRDRQAKIQESIDALAPQLDGELRHKLVNQLQSIVSEDSSAYVNGAAFVSAYVEGALLDVFIEVAKKNPTTRSKDSMGVLTEKLLNTVMEKYVQAKSDPEGENFSGELNDAIMQELLGIDSPATFKSLPEGVQPLVYEAVKNQVGEMVSKVQEGLKLINSENEALKARKEESKKFGIEEGATKGVIEQFSLDVIDMVLHSVLFSLAEETGEDRKGVVMISKNIEGVVRDLARGNMEVGKVLLNYRNEDHFKGILRDHLAVIGDPKKLVEDKKIVVDLVGNFLFDFTNTAVEKSVAFAEKEGEVFTRQLMTRILGISADHLRHLNDARELAAAQGRSTIRHADFTEALNKSGEQLHPAVPYAPATYEKTLEALRNKLYPNMTEKEQALFVRDIGAFRYLIDQKVNDEMRGIKLLSIVEFSEELSEVFVATIGRALTEEEKQALDLPDESGFALKDIMRKEGDAFDLQRKENAQVPAADAILQMVFPNGKADLEFVPEELRGTVWDLFKKNLLPVIFTTLTDVVLDPQMIHTIVLKSLENANKTLKGDVRWQPPEPVDRSPEARALDQVSGKLIAEALRATTLPKWAQNMLKDENGEISDAMKESVGATLRKQFNGSFIRDQLQTALKNAVGRDEAGKPVLKFTPKTKRAKELDRRAETKKTERELKKAFRETVYVSIGYYFRSRWANFQHDFDELITKACGDKGAKVKHYLDMAFRKFFIEIGVNIVLYWLSTPIRWAVKKVVDAFIDANRESILKLLTEVPHDRPEAALKNYALYHEDLLYKAGQAVSEVIDEFINKDPVVASI